MKHISEFLPKTPEVLVCIDWLNRQKITNTINYDHTSYGLKHKVTDWSGIYVHNDDFIEAVKFLGIKHQQADEKNIYIAISKIIN